MEVKIAKIEERLYRCESDVGILGKKVDSLSNVYLALTKVNDKVDRVECDVSEIKDDIKNLTKAPLQRWNSIVDTIIKVTIGALVSYTLLRIGIGG